MFSRAFGAQPQGRGVDARSLAWESSRHTPYAIAGSVSALASAKSESERGKKKISSHETGYSMAAAQPLCSKSRRLMLGAVERNRCPARVAGCCVIDLGPDDGATGAEANLMYGDGVLVLVHPYELFTRGNLVRRY